MTSQEPINRDDIEKAPEERDHGRDEDSLFNSDLADHLNELVDLPGRKSSEAFITTPMLNYSIPWQTRGDLETDELTKFMPESSEQLFAYDKQVHNEN